MSCRTKVIVIVNTCNNNRCFKRHHTQITTNNKHISFILWLRKNRARQTAIVQENKRWGFFLRFYLFEGLTQPFSRQLVASRGPRNHQGPRYLLNTTNTTQNKPISPKYQHECSQSDATGHLWPAGAPVTTRAPLLVTCYRTEWCLMGNK